MKNFKFKVTYEGAVLSGIINGIMTLKGHLENQVIQGGTFRRMKEARKLI